MIDPVYPQGAAAQLQESTVELTMTIDVRGKAHDVKVVRSTGARAFDHAAVQAVERWTFAAATQDGRPVESPFRVRHGFFVNTRDTPQQRGGAQLANVKRGARTEFTTAYASLQKAVQAGDRAAAEAALQKLQPTNQYEEASIGLAAYQYTARWGDQQQLEALQHAVRPDNAAQDFAYSEHNYDEFEHYLPVEVWKTALLTLLNLEIKTRAYPAALETWGVGCRRQASSRISRRSSVLSWSRSKHRPATRPEPCQQAGASGRVPDFLCAAPSSRRRTGQRL